jgi:hypothetical protein
LGEAGWYGGTNLEDLRRAMAVLLLFGIQKLDAPSTIIAAMITNPFGRIQAAGGETKSKKSASI